MAFDPSAPFEVLDEAQPAAPDPALSGARVTSYGYASDPNGDSASLGRGAFRYPTGAWDNRLSDTSFAASPDIETYLRQQGVNPKGQVRVTFDDGSSEVRTWDDRTAQDQQILAGRVPGVTKPLRGRVDFFSSAGPHPLDGRRVLRMEPVKSESIGQWQSPTGTSGFDPAKPFEVVNDQPAPSGFNPSAPFEVITEPRATMGDARMLDNETLRQPTVDEFMAKALAAGPQEPTGAPEEQARAQREKQLRDSHPGMSPQDIRAMMAVDSFKGGVITPAVDRPFIEIPKPEATSIAGGVARGTLDMVEGLETPKNAMIAAGSSVLPPMAQKLVGMGFGADMMRSAPDEVNAALTAKTPGEAAQHWTRAALAFIGGGAIAAHSVAGRPVTGGDNPEARVTEPASGVPAPAPVPPAAPGAADATPPIADPFATAEKPPVGAPPAAPAPPQSAPATVSTGAPTRPVNTARQISPDYNGFLVNAINQAQQSGGGQAVAVVGKLRLPIRKGIGTFGNVLGDDVILHDGSGLNMALVDSIEGVDGSVLWEKQNKSAGTAPKVATNEPAPIPTVPPVAEVAKTEYPASLLTTAAQYETAKDFGKALRNPYKDLPQNNKVDAPYSGEKFKEGEVWMDDYGENPYVYESRYIDPKVFKEDLKLEGMTYEQVAAMPTTQQYIDWYKEGHEPPPIDVVKKQETGGLFSTNRRRVVAALEAGVDKIPARIEIGRRDDIWKAAQQSIEPDKAGTKSVESEKPFNGQPTSVKNAATDIDRTAQALQSAGEPERRPWTQVDAEAREVLTKDPATPDRLITELEARPRQVSDTESAVLAYRWSEAKRTLESANDAVNNAYDAGDPAALEAAKATRDQAETQAQRTADVLRAVGTKAGQGLAARKMFNAEDYSLAGMQRNYRAKAGGRPLSEEEAAFIRLQHEKITEAKKAADTYEASKTDQAANDALGAELVKLFQETKGEQEAARPSRVRKIADTLKGKADKAREFLRQKQENPGAMSGPLDPLELDAYITIGAAHIAEGVAKFEAWASRMAREFGDKVKPHLQSIFDGSKKRVLDEMKTATEAQPKDTLGKLRKRLEDGGDISRAYVRKLARDYIASGIEKRDELVNAVHKALETVKPGISRSEARDLLSGYGETSKLPTDDVSVKLRAMTGELQQIAKIEDMRAGQAPKKTGPERRTPSDAERALIKEVEALKKKGGYNVTDPATQLKTALEAVRTRLKNELRDIAERLDTGRKPPGKTPLEYDEQTKALKEVRDRIKRNLQDIEGKPEMSDADRLKVAQKALETSIAEYERRIRTEDLTPRGPKTQAWSPEVAAMRARRNALKAQYDELKSLADDVSGEGERRALSAYKTRVAKQIEQLHDRLAREDFGPRPKKAPPTLDAEGIRLRAALEMQKREFSEGALKKMLKNRSLPGKVFGTAKEGINTARAVMTSLDLSAVLRQGGVLSFAHPIRAAKAFPAMFNALLSERRKSIVEQEIRERPNAQLYKDAKLYLAEEGTSLSKMEEAYMSRWAKKIPLVAASERAYTTFLNRLRADSFDAMAASLGRRGKVGLEEARAIANFVNVATGRGDLGKFDQAGTTLATFFFAPRYAVSRFQLLAGQPLYRGTARTRALVAGEYARYLTGVGLVLALGVTAGGQLGVNPQSSEFGKLKFGNTRIDLLSGITQATVFASRESDALLRFLTQDPSKPKDYRSGGDVLGRFLRSKLSPLFGSAVDAAEHKNLVGEKVSPADVAKRAVIPLSFGDIAGAMKDQGVGRGTIFALLALFGAGVQNYEAKPKR